MKKTNQIPRDTRRHCQHGIPADVCQFCANDSVVRAHPHDAINAPFELRAMAFVAVHAPWGSSLQIDADKRFTCLVEEDLTPRQLRDYETSCLKATVAERVALGFGALGWRNAAAVLSLDDVVVRPGHRP